ncbi:unnamed protein product [Scytosiphon promiscuus]
MLFTVIAPRSYRTYVPRGKLGTGSSVRRCSIQILPAKQQSRLFFGKANHHRRSPAMKSGVNLSLASSEFVTGRERLARPTCFIRVMGSSFLVCRRGLSSLFSSVAYFVFRAHLNVTGMIERPLFTAVQVVSARPTLSYRLLSFPRPIKGSRTFDRVCSKSWTRPVAPNWGHVGRGCCLALCNKEKATADAVGDGRVAIGEYFGFSLPDRNSNDKSREATCTCTLRRLMCP